MGFPIEIEFEIEESRELDEVTGEAVVAPVLLGIGRWSRWIAVAGGLGLLDARRRAVGAVAMEDTTLVRLGRENLDRLVDDHPRLGAELLKGVLLAISLRLRSSFERLSVVF